MNRRGVLLGRPRRVWVGCRYSMREMFRDPPHGGDAALIGCGPVNASPPYPERRAIVLDAFNRANERSALSRNHDNS
jgi:hypothetical protein